MVQKTLTTILLAAVLCSPAVADATSRRDEDESPFRAAFGLQDWISSASAKWQISFPYRTRFANPGIRAGTAGTVESELDLEGYDSHLVIVTGGAQLAPLISFEVAYGVGSIGGRTGQGRRALRPERKTGIRVFRIEK